MQESLLPPSIGLEALGCRGLFWLPRLPPRPATATATVKASCSPVGCSALCCVIPPSFAEHRMAGPSLAGQGGLVRIGSSIAVAALNSSRRSSPVCLLPPMPSLLSNVRVSDYSQRRSLLLLLYRATSPDHKPLIPVAEAPWKMTTLAETHSS